MPMYACGCDPIPYPCPPYPPMPPAPTGITGPTGPTGSTGATGPKATIPRATAVPTLADTAQLTELISGFNQMIANLEAAGLME